MGRRPDDAGHTAIVEAILVGFTVIAAVAFVATYAEPDATTSSARSALTSGGTDALYVLSELPASPGSPHESLLEEHVTRALRGDCAPLDEKLAGYLPDGATWGLYLEKGHGEALTICSTGDAVGEQLTTFTTIQPRWNKLFVVPNVTQINGFAELDIFGYPVDVDPLSMHGVLVRNSFVDETTNVTLTFENGYTTTFHSKNGLRSTGALTPEFVSALGPHEGYAAPYDTTGTWLGYKTDTMDVTPPPRTFTVEHNLGSISELHGIEYEVHPGYTLSGAISSAIDTLDQDDKFQPNGKQAHLGSSMTFTWNYGRVASTLTNLRLADGTLTLYNPVGAVADEMAAPTWNGNRSFEIEKDMLWGTYVAHLSLELQEVNSFGVPTGKVYVVNRLAHFSVLPPEWADLPEYIPPVYRVTLSVGMQDWQ